MSLFELLDWCVAHTPANTVTAHSGLELLPSTNDISSTTVSNTSTQSRLGSCECDHVAEGASLQGSVEGALMELSRVVVRHNADKYAVHWILFCRAVALSLRSSTGKSEPTGAAGAGDVEEDDGGAEEVGDDEDGFVVVTETISGRKNTPSPHTKEKVDKGLGAAPVLSYQQYAVWCRDQAVFKVQGLPLIVRVRVKSVAVGCASETVNQLLLLKERRAEDKTMQQEQEQEAQAQRLGGGISNEEGQRESRRGKILAEEHIDLGLARKSSQLALTAAAAASSGDKTGTGVGAAVVGQGVGGSVGPGTGTGIGALSDVPCYFALFMHDVINLACACASFTIDDNRILGLLKVSIHLLKGTIDFFKRSLDPDSDSSQAAPTKVLSQFISQLMSAVRPCFTLSRSPGLLGVAGALTITLIEEGLVVDKVVLKRLVKALSQTEEMAQSSGSARNININVGDLATPTGAHDSTSVRAAVSLDNNEDVGALEHVIRACAAARLYSLANDITPRAASESILRPSAESSSSKNINIADNSHHNAIEGEGGGEGVSIEVRACINAVMKSRTPHFRALWLAIAVDSARVMQSAGVDAVMLNGSSEHVQGHGKGQGDVVGGASGGVILQELGVRASVSSKKDKGSGKASLSSRSSDGQYAPPTATEGREPIAPPVRDLSSLVTISSHSLDGADQSVVCINLKPADSAFTLDPFKLSVETAAPTRTVSTGHTAHAAKGGYIWTLASPSTDARRGGLIYGPFVRPSILRGTLERHLPAIIAASALALKINSSSSSSSSSSSRSRSSSSAGGKSNGADEVIGQGTFDLMNGLVARCKAAKEQGAAAVPTPPPTPASEGICDASLLFAIGMTALTHRLKKYKSRKAKSSAAQHKTDVDRLCAIMSALTLLSSLPFSPSTPSSISPLPIQSSAANVHSDADADAEKEAEIVKLKTKSCSAIPHAQWSRLISFTLRTLLPITRHQSKDSIPNSIGNSYIQCASLHNSAFVAYLINITSSISKEFSSSSLLRGGGVREKGKGHVLGTDNIEASGDEDGTDSKYSGGVDRLGAGVNDDLGSEAHKLKSWTVTVSIYLLSCLFPVIAAATAADATTTAAAAASHGSSATATSRKEGAGEREGREEQSRYTHVLNGLLKGSLPGLATAPCCPSVDEESAMKASMRQLQRSCVQSSSGNRTIDSYPLISEHLHGSCCSPYRPMM